MENLTVLHFLKLYFSGLKIILFFSRISKNNIDLISPKNANKKNFYFWTKTMAYPLRKMSIFFDFLKLQFSGLELFFFYPEYQKTIFSNIISLKTLVRKILNYPGPYDNVHFLALFKTLIFGLDNRIVRKLHIINIYLMTKNLNISQIQILTIFLSYTFCYYSSGSFVTSTSTRQLPFHSWHGKAKHRVGWF